MYGRTITFMFEGYAISVFMFCTPDTTDEQLAKRAKRALLNKLLTSKDKEVA